MDTLKAGLVFEASWEVCNKVGGIYTVVKSKAANMIGLYKNNYFLIGPYFIKKAYGEFQEEVPQNVLKSVFDRLRQEGIECHCGKWLVEGAPSVILIDFTKFTVKTNDIKKQLWEDYRIDSLGTNYFDFDEPVVWATAVGRLLQEISAHALETKIVAHFHEWLAGASILYLKKNKVRVGTVFTTHATILGRTIASSGQDLYSIYDKVDPEKEAYRLGIQAKYLLERACAQNCDVFTTVSEITGMEAKNLLKRNPDVLLPNGLDLEKFPTQEDLSVKHRLFREKIHDFIAYYFFPYYVFDIEDTLIFFLAGRYEFRDKGIDVYIRALGMLNEKLRKEGSNKTIIAFLWIPGNVQGVISEILENKTLYKDLSDTIADEMVYIKTAIMNTIISQKPLVKTSIFSSETLNEIKVKLKKFQREGKPSICTHHLFDEGHDEIINAIKKEGLTNSKEDKIKVVYYAIYLTGADNLLDTSYYESMIGSHLGIFPSYYEPWGYTPLEAAALGVPSVTTDLAGFGRYIQKKSIDGDAPGIFVIPRMNKNTEEVAGELAKVLYDYCKLSKHERVANKIAAKKMSLLADWKELIKNYADAHNLAVEKVLKQ